MKKSPQTIIFFLIAVLGFVIWYYKSYLPKNSSIPAFMEELASQERCFVLTQDHINLLKKSPVVWISNVENGMAMLDLNLSSLPPSLTHFRELFRSEQNKLELESSFQIFMAFAEMNPGDYSLLVGDVIEKPDNSKNDKTIRRPVEFKMTEPHLKLLKNLSVEWERYFNGLVTDPKRPYGDMTYFELDMADILGIPLKEDSKGQRQISSEQQKLFNQLFSDLPWSLRVFLKNATLSPGKFCRKPAGWGPWRRVSL